MRDKANKIHYEWTARACRYIRHPADRRLVQAELDAHMQDRISELTDGGLRYHDALARVAAAMVDPDDVGKLLGRIHTPWMSWLLTASKWICAGLILFSLCFYGRQVWWDIEARFLYDAQPWTNEETYAYYCSNYEGKDMTACGIRPVPKATVGDYTFRVVRGNYLSHGSLILWIESDHPFWKADPEGFMNRIAFYNDKGQLLRGNRNIDGDTAIFEVFDGDDAEINPVTLVADYGGKGFTWVIEPEVTP